MTTEQAGRGKFAQTMSDHIIGDIHRDMAASVMNGDGMTNQLREDCAGAAPGADEVLVAGMIHCVNHLEKFRVNERPFLQ